MKISWLDCKVRQKIHDPFEGQLKLLERYSHRSRSYFTSV